MCKTFWMIGCSNFVDIWRACFGSLQPQIPCGPVFREQSLGSTSPHSWVTVSYDELSGTMIKPEPNASLITLKVKPSSWGLNGVLFALPDTVIKEWTAFSFSWAVHLYVCVLCLFPVCISCFLIYVIETALCIIKVSWATTTNRSVWTQAWHISVMF